MSLMKCCVKQFAFIKVNKGTLIIFLSVGLFFSDYVITIYLPILDTPGSN